MKILVIFTGGTIGSSKIGKYTSPDEKNNYVLIDNFLSKNSCDISFDTLAPISMLSENLSYSELNTIIKNIGDNLDNGYDGIILTHGTDSLQYTAAALSYCFPAINIPVVLVSSRFPLEHPKQNGDDNFSAAVEFIKEKSKGGVYISYKNEDSDVTHIHMGTRVYSHLENNDWLYSINDSFYAYVKDGKVTLNKDCEETGAKSENNYYEFKNDSKVLVITSVPGDDFSYNLQGKKAVLLRPYHSGTVNTASKEFKDFCMRAKEEKIPVFIPKAGIETDYESTKLFEELSIKYISCMTTVAAYIKLWIATSNEYDITSFMYEQISNEFVK